MMKERFRAKAESHPTWVRGLKLKSEEKSVIMRPSHPTWVRGLKFEFGADLRYGAESHPTWVRGLKSIKSAISIILYGRTPRGCVD